MNAAFADTSFYVAISNTRDALHGRAKALAESFTGLVITTEFVLVEVANFLKCGARRAKFGELVGHLRTAERVEIIPASAELSEQGRALFACRPDKEWSLTDCTFSWSWRIAA